MNDFNFDPVTGLLDTSAYPTQPTTEAQARQQFMDLFNQIKTYLNSVKAELDLKTVKAIEAPIAPTMLNGWVNYGSGHATLKYWKDDLGYVYIKGTVKSGTNDQVIFNLPVGYRPLENLFFAADDNATHSYVYVGSDGVVTGHSNVRLSINAKFRAGI